MTLFVNDFGYIPSERIYMPKDRKWDYSYIYELSIAHAQEGYTATEFINKFNKEYNIYQDTKLALGRLRNIVYTQSQGAFYFPIKPYAEKIKKGQMSFMEWLQEKQKGILSDPTKKAILMTFANSTGETYADKIKDIMGKFGLTNQRAKDIINESPQKELELDRQVDKNRKSYDDTKDEGIDLLSSIADLRKVKTDEIMLSLYQNNSLMCNVLSQNLITRINEEKAHIINNNPSLQNDNRWAGKLNDKLLRDIRVFLRDRGFINNEELVSSYLINTHKIIESMKILEGVIDGYEDEEKRLLKTIQRYKREGLIEEISDDNILDIGTIIEHKPNVILEGDSNTNG